MLTSPMCENACGKLPTSRPAPDVVLLREQAEVVAERQQPLEHLDRLVQLAEQHQVVDEPERAEEERALARRQAVDRGRLLVVDVALDEAVLVELRCGPARACPRTAGRRREEADQRDRQEARVDALRAVPPDERVELRVEALLHHLRVDLLPHLAPAVDRPVALELLDGDHARGRTPPTPSPSSA